MTQSKLFCCMIFIIASFLVGCGGISAKKSIIAEKTIRNSQITAAQLPEISGLAKSIVQADDLWAINDSGNPPELIRLGVDLAVVQTVGLAIKNRDWEDLAAFSLDGEAWLVIAETGDNLQSHEDYFLYFYREQNLLGAGQKKLRPDKIMRFVFENGAQNCEALAIDSRSRQILLFGKNSVDGGVYTLPLSVADSMNRQTARRIASLNITGNLRASLITALTGVNLDAATAAAISDDGRQALVLTYRDVWRYNRKPGQSWAEVFALPPIRLAKHSLQQAEALTIDNTRSEVIITSEELPAPVMRIPF